MALTDLKQGILNEAQGKARVQQDDARAQAKQILDEARKRASQISADAHSTAQAERKLRMQEAESDAETEATGVLSEALEAVAGAEEERIQRLVERELGAKHMAQLAAKALKQFAEVTDKENTIVEITKRHAPLIKGVGKVVPVAEQGRLVLYTKDRKVRLDGSAESLAESSAAAIKGAIIREIQERSV